MAILFRSIQHINPDKWEELEQFDKEMSALEKKNGSPPKKRYRMISGSDTMNLIQVERVFESFADCEAYFKKLNADPEVRKTVEKYPDVVIDFRVEFHEVLPTY